MNSRSDPYLLATLRQRVAEQVSRWQELPASPGHVMSWIAADQMIDQGRRAVVELETYQNPRERAKNAPTINRKGVQPPSDREKAILRELGF